MADGTPAADPTPSSVPPPKLDDLTREEVDRISALLERFKEDKPAEDDLEVRPTEAKPESSPATSPAAEKYEIGHGLLQGLVNIIMVNPSPNVPVGDCVRALVAAERVTPIVPLVKSDEDRIAELEAELEKLRPKKKSKRAKKKTARRRRAKPATDDPPKSSSRRRRRPKADGLKPENEA